MLAATLAAAVWCAASGGPVLVTAGLFLAGASPAAFLAWRAIARPAETGPQSLATSSFTGLGLVLIMAHNYRFGDDFQWALGLALLSLVGWLLWMRRVLRATSGEE